MNYIPPHIGIDQHSFLMKLRFIQLLDSPPSCSYMYIYSAIDATPPGRWSTVRNLNILNGSSGVCGGG